MVEFQSPKKNKNKEACGEVNLEEYGANNLKTE